MSTAHLVMTVLLGGSACLGAVLLFALPLMPLFLMRLAKKAAVEKVVKETGLSEGTVKVGAAILGEMVESDDE